MNITPQQIDGMALYQYSAMVAGFGRFHGAEEQPSAPSDEEYFDMVRRAGL
tara:strand:+ start:1229 stop:1381 length:153 start_codon:yes stop_codon:yes gene_type:complete